MCISDDLYLTHTPYSCPSILKYIDPEIHTLSPDE